MPRAKKNSTRSRKQLQGPLANEPALEHCVLPDRFKTSLCRSFEENGVCEFSDTCAFAHGAHELRTREQNRLEGLGSRPPADVQRQRRKANNHTPATPNAGPVRARRTPNATAAVVPKEASRAPSLCPPSGPPSRRTSCASDAALLSVSHDGGLCDSSRDTTPNPRVLSPTLTTPDMPAGLPPPRDDHHDDLRLPSRNTAGHPAAAGAPRGTPLGHAGARSRRSFAMTRAATMPGAHPAIPVISVDHADAGSGTTPIGSSETTPTGAMSSVAPMTMGAAHPHHRARPFRHDPYAAAPRYAAAAAAALSAASYF